MGHLEVKYIVIKLKKKKTQLQLERELVNWKVDLRKSPRKNHRNKEKENMRWKLTDTNRIGKSNIFLPGFLQRE